MTVLWIASESSELAGTLAALLGPAGEVYTGAPAREAFEGAPVPDLLVLGATDAAGAPAPVMERFLGFLAGVPHVRRAPQPALFIEPSSGQPSGRLARVLIDDRPLHVLSWPIDPDDLLRTAADALEQPHLPASLRERARQRWVTERVELLYAPLDLPALRHAVDPRNAHRPVLLLGERGTRRALLARYVHNLAEPERERLVTLAADTLRGDVERRVLDATSTGRTTVYLDELDRLDPFEQQDLAHFLGASGALAIEQVRWIASASRAVRLTPELRLLPWIRVELPPVRERPDRASLVDRLVAAWSARTGRAVRILDEAREALDAYTWPGNLRELEGAIEATLANAPGEEIRLVDVRLGARLELPSQQVEPSRSRPAEPATPSAPPAPPPEPGPGPVATPASPPAPPSPEPGGGVASLVPDRAAPAAEPEPIVIAEPEPEPEPEPIVIAERKEPRPPAPGLDDILPPLAHEIRRPLLAIRTYASLLDQRPDDEAVRRELTSLVDDDLGRLEIGLEQLERYLKMQSARIEPFDLAATIGEELDARRDAIRDGALVLLRELEHGAPPARGDAEQIRFAVGILLDRALRMIPRGGDLYVGSLFRAASGGHEAGHRVLLRFHSPEDVLLGPEDGPDPALPVEVILARELVARSGGSFEVDASGEDNVVILELAG